jgi:hypothetical protein
MIRTKKLRGLLSVSTGVHAPRSDVTRECSSGVCPSPKRIEHQESALARRQPFQTRDRELAAIFTPVAQQLEQQESTIVAELNGVQGKPVEIGGYYHLDPRLTSTAMRPSATLNRIIESLNTR